MLGRRLNDFTPLLTSRALQQRGIEGYQTPFLDRTFADMRREDEEMNEAIDLESLDPETRQEIARELQNERMINDAEEDQQFQSAMADLLTDMLQAFDMTREDKINFSERYRLAERRSETRLDIYLDEHGAVDENRGDGDRRLRLTLGLSASAITTVASVDIRYLFSGGMHLNDLIGKGVNDENIHKEVMGYALLRDQHKKGRLIPVVKKFVYDRATFPLAVMQQRWCRKSALREDPETGFLKETVVHEGSMFENVPLPWVWFSDINKSRVEDQRFILQYRRRSLAEVERDEVVWDLEDGGVGPNGEPLPPIPRVVAGRYHNLDDVREDISQWTPDIQMRDTQLSETIFPIFDEARDIDRGLWDVTMPVGELYGEGHLQLSHLVEDGTITPKTVERWDWPIEDPWNMSKRALGRILDSILWNITLSDKGVLMEMRPCPENPPRLSYYAEAWQPGKGLYGFSVVDRAGELEDMADQIVNDNLQISERIADPLKVFNDQAITDINGQRLTPQQMQRIASGKGGVIVVRGIDVGDAYMEVKPDANPNWVQEFMLLKELLDERLMISDELRGNSSADTLGQARQDLSRSQERTVISAETIGENVLQVIDENVFLDMERFYDEQTFEQKCIEVAGDAGLHAHYVFPSVRGLANTFDIIHAGSPQANREVRQAQLFQMAQFYVPLGVGDPEVYQEAQLQLNQEKSPERFKTGGQRARDARQEIKAFANNHYLAPVPSEDALGHYRMHLQQLLPLLKDPSLLSELNPDFVFAAIAPRTPGGPIQLHPVSTPPGLEHFKFDPEVIIPQLIEHMKATEPLIEFQLQQKMMLMQQQAQGALPAPGGDGEAQGGQNNISADVKGADATALENNAANPNLGLPAGLGSTQ